jgi:hypothetical protein
MADLLGVVLYGVLPAVAAALLLVGWLGPRWLGLAAGLGLLVSWGLLRKQLPAWPWQLYTGTNDATQWFCWCALGIGAISTFGGGRLRLRPRQLAWSGAVACLLLEGWLMLTNLRRRWDIAQAWLQLGLAGIVCVAVWAAVRRAITDRGSAVQLWLLAACLAGDSCVLLLSGSALQGQLAGAVAAAYAAGAGCSLWRHPFRIDRAVALPFAAAHCWLLLAGLHFSELRLLPALLAVAAPAALALAGRRVDGVGAAGRRLAGTAVAAALVGGAVALAFAGN